MRAATVHTETLSAVVREHQEQIDPVIGRSASRIFPRSTDERFNPWGRHGARPRGAGIRLQAPMPTNKVNAAVKIFDSWFA